MDVDPGIQSLILSTLPFLGLSVLAIVLVALATKRDRYILPGVLVAFLAISSWGAAREYGEPMLAMLSPQEAPAPDPGDKEGPIDLAANDLADEEEVEIGSDKKDSEDEVDESDRSEMIPIGDPRWRPPARRGSSGHSGSRYSSSRTQQPTERPTKTHKTRTREKSGRKTSDPMLNPDNFSSSKKTSTKKSSDPMAAPWKTRSGGDKTSSPRRTNFKVGPSSGGRSSGGGGTGKLTIRISGPMVETSNTPSSSAHLLVIIDGKKTSIKKPSRTEKKFTGGDSVSGIQSITYFWNNVTITFSGLSAGPHEVLIGTSLADSGTNRGRMMSGDVAYSGSVNVPANGRATMEFSHADFMSGRLKSVR